MTHLPLSQTVDASRRKRSWRSSALSLVTSTLVQGLVLLAAIVTPLVASQALPEPVLQLHLPDFPVIPTAPPPARGPTKAQPAKSRAPSTTPRVPEDVWFYDEPVDYPISDVPVQEWGDPNGVDGGAQIDVPPSILPLPPPAPTRPGEPLQVGRDIRPPRKIVHVNPLYPAIALSARVHGLVILRAVIDEDGNVVNLSVVESVRLLDTAAVDAVQQWKYEPSYLNGRPVPVIMSVSVDFKLR